MGKDQAHEVSQKKQSPDGQGQQEKSKNDAKRNGNHEPILPP
jgi:hypothetical protein